MSGCFIQSRFGTQGNFEVVVPDTASGGLAHFWRNNDDPSLSWNGPTLFGSGLLGNVDGVSLIQSNFGSPGNLEVIAIAHSKGYHFWRDSGPSFTWNGPYTFAFGVFGIPALIQSRFGTQGNFEVVVSRGEPALGLVHYWRNNDDPSFPWSGPTPFAAGLSSQNRGVSLIQSNFGSPGNLEVMVVGDDGQARHFWRDSGPSLTWNEAETLAGPFADCSLIQSRFGSQGNFEFVASDGSSGVFHYWRNNDDPSFPWSGPTPLPLILPPPLVPFR